MCLNRSPTPSSVEALSHNTSLALTYCTVHTVLYLLWGTLQEWFFWSFHPLAETWDWTRKHWLHLDWDQILLQVTRLWEWDCCGLLRLYPLASLGVGNYNGMMSLKTVSRRQRWQKQSSLSTGRFEVAYGKWVCGCVTCMCMYCLSFTQHVFTLLHSEVYQHEYYHLWWKRAVSWAMRRYVWVLWFMIFVFSLESS